MCFGRVEYGAGYTAAAATRSERVFGKDIGVRQQSLFLRTHISAKSENMKLTRNHGKNRGCSRDIPAGTDTQIKNGAELDRSKMPSSWSKQVAGSQPKLKV